MKQLIEKFKKENPIPNIYISYGKMWDLDVDVETLGNNVFLISSTKKMFRLERKTEFYTSIFETYIDGVLINGQEYIYKPYSFDSDEFVVLLDLESEEFEVFGNFNRAKTLAALNRIATINQGIKKIENESSKGIEFLNANYPWLHFSMQGPNDNELHFDGDLIGGFVILYPSGVWEIDSSIEKSFERAMKRVLKYK
jgi:hypothetical protein